ncbi:MAG: hypothetical protein DRP78_06510 [Candidatus Omnitrophota bacterium]|nr:MAG: hypothetical protein DRP78_06510 [Candidatus Omnitrophota bacterium]
MSLTHRELSLAVIYMIIVVCIGVYLLFVNMGYARYKQINSDIIACERALGKINFILARKNVIEKEYNTFREKLASKKIEQTISTEILQEIKGKAAFAGLNVINIKPFYLKDEGLYGRFDFKIETEGELQNLGRFLYNLDDSPYIFAVKYMQLNAQKQQEFLKMQLLLTTTFSKG